MLNGGTAMARIEIRSGRTGRPLRALREKDGKYFVKIGGAYGEGKWHEIPWTEVEALIERFAKKGHKFYVVSIEYSPYADDYGYFEHEVSPEEALEELW